MENKGDFFAGIVVGSVLGAIIGCMFAPASGQVTRQKVADKGKEFGNMAMEKAKEKSETILEVSKNIVAQLKDKLPGSCEVQEALESIEEDLS